MSTALGARQKQPVLNHVSNTAEASLRRSTRSWDGISEINLVIHHNFFSADTTKQKKSNISADWLSLHLYFDNSCIRINIIQATAEEVSLPDQSFRSSKLSIPTVLSTICSWVQFLSAVKILLQISTYTQSSSNQSQKRQTRHVKHNGGKGGANKTLVGQPGWKKLLKNLGTNKGSYSLHCRETATLHPERATNAEQEKLGQGNCCLGSVLDE